MQRVCGECCCDIQFTAIAQQQLPTPAESQHHMPAHTCTYTHRLTQEKVRAKELTRPAAAHWRPGCRTAGPAAWPGTRPAAAPCSSRPGVAAGREPVLISRHGRSQSHVRTRAMQLDQSIAHLPPLKLAHDILHPAIPLLLPAAAHLLEIVVRNY